MTTRRDLREALAALGLDDDTIEEFLALSRSVNRKAATMITRTKPSAAVKAPVQVRVRYRPGPKKHRAGYSKIAERTLSSLGLEQLQLSKRARALVDGKRERSTGLTAREAEAQINRIEADLDYLPDEHPRRRALQLQLRMLRRGRSGMAEVAAETLTDMDGSRTPLSHVG